MENKEYLYRLEQLKEQMLNSAKWDRQIAFNIGTSIPEIERHYARYSLKEYFAKIIDKEFTMNIPNLDELEIQKKRIIFDKKLETFKSRFGMGYNRQEFDAMIRFIINNFNVD